jgi:hypothetical protein
VGPDVAQATRDADAVRPDEHPVAKVTRVSVITICVPALPGFLPEIWIGIDRCGIR